MYNEYKETLNVNLTITQTKKPKKSGTVSRKKDWGNISIGNLFISE